MTVAILASAPGAENSNKAYEYIEKSIALKCLNEPCRSAFTATGALVPTPGLISSVWIHCMPVFPAAARPVGLWLYEQDAPDVGTANAGVTACSGLISIACIER
jgi:hypothetical protein